MSKNHYYFDTDIYNVGGEILSRRAIGYKMYSSKSFENMIAHRTLSAILYRGGKTRLAKKVAKIANEIEDPSITIFSSWEEKHDIDTTRKYRRLLRKFGHLDSHDMHNVSSLISSLCRETDQDLMSKLTNGYGETAYSVEALSDLDCRRLAKNFVREMRGRDPKSYNEEKGYSK